jgi:tetraacyldisaccharide 4'-kinase
VERVDPAGSAERFGDEPLLIAQSAQVPVYVGASRYAAGLLAERDRSGACAHLLDDGFQHRRLARDADIVVVHRTDLSETLLPAGRLREPISALHRASVLVLRDEDRDLEAPLRQRGIEQQIWWIQRSIILPATMGSAVAFCGIARPEEFFQSLRRNGVEAVAEVAFADHHRYTEFDMDALIRRAQTEKAETFLTTEKDFVRLLPAQREKLATVAPLRVVELQAVLLDEAEVLRYFETLLPSIFPQSM